MVFCVKGKASKQKEIVDILKLAGKKPEWRANYSEHE